MKTILLSYDYELYFNESFFDEDEVLIKPSEQIFNGYLHAGVRCTFFVDTEFILKYKSIGKNDFVLKVEKQLLDFISNGFDVQLHIHPLWEYSKFENGKWHFNYDYYNMKDFDIDTICSIVERGKKYLEGLLTQVKSDYQCIAFRAGGFCLPNNEEFLSFLNTIGIKYDSSVIPNCKMVSKYQAYDYCGSKEKIKSNNVSEIPLLTFRKFNIYYALNRKKHLLKQEMRGKGSPIVSKKRPLFFISDKLFRNAIITLDVYDYMFISGCLKRLKNKTISIVGHPKIESKRHIESVLKLVDKEKNNCCFKTFSELDV